MGSRRNGHLLLHQHLRQTFDSVRPKSKKESPFLHDFPGCSVHVVTELVSNDQEMMIFPTLLLASASYVLADSSIIR